MWAQQKHEYDEKNAFIFKKKVNSDIIHGQILMAGCILVLNRDK